MKKILFIIFAIISFAFNAQTVEADYEFKVNNKVLHNTHTFPATLKFDRKSGTKFYKVQFGIQSSENLPDNFFTSKKKPVYFIYGKEKEPVTIFENVPNVKETDYVFTDEYDMKWSSSDETKTVDNIKLSKAETDFRGRHYIAWYDSKNNISAGPWKFKNVPGLIYEVYDTMDSFRWKLTKITVHNEKIENPFNSYTGVITSFHQYPELRYGLTPELKKELAKVPNNTFHEQERNGLETKFEWEN